ncbi:MAG: alpha-L-arabinofuranosidase C-terminal domain-containing protein, partial [Mucilaginibacter sp.]
PLNKNNWQCAMSEAAFMTGLERNADVVNMASYAPLFANVDAWQWTPDLIWFNSLKSYGTPNYYVQQLYSLNKGTDVVPVTRNSQTVTGQDGLFASSVLDKKKGVVIVKIINTGNKAQQSDIVIKGKKGIDPKGELITLHSDDLSTVNSIDNPENIAPVSSAIVYKQGKVSLKLQPYSFNVIRLRYKN